jgi:hypothetical protein
MNHVTMSEFRAPAVKLALHARLERNSGCQQKTFFLISNERFWLAKSQLLLVRARLELDSGR